MPKLEFEINAKKIIGVFLLIVSFFFGYKVGKNETETVAPDKKAEAPPDVSGKEPPPEWVDLDETPSQSMEGKPPPRLTDEIPSPTATPRSIFKD